MKFNFARNISPAICVAQLKSVAFAFVVTYVYARIAGLSFSSTSCLYFTMFFRVCKRWKWLVKDQRLWRIVDLTEWKGVRILMARWFYPF